MGIVPMIFRGIGILPMMLGLPAHGMVTMSLV
jgi:hypothetical protein